MGREGYGFNANLLENKKKVAFVINEGNGGCFNWQWYDKDARKRFYDHIATMPEHSEYPIEFDDHVIAVLIDDYDFDKKMKRICKKQTVFTINDNKDYKALNVKYVSENIDSIIKYLSDKFGTGNFEIINKKYI